MSARRSLLLFSVGAGLFAGGIYAINNIGTVLEGQRWSVTFLTGLGIGVLPLFVGAFLMAGVFVATLKKRSRSERS